MKKIIAFYLFLICFTCAGCTSQVNREPSDILDPNKTTSANPPELIYADEKIVIFTSVQGISVWDQGKKEIRQHRKIDLSFLGELYSPAPAYRASQNGDVVYIGDLNEPDFGFCYQYLLESNIVEEIDETIVRLPLYEADMEVSAEELRKNYASTNMLTINADTAVFLEEYGADSPSPYVLVEVDLTTNKTTSYPIFPQPK